MDITAVHPMGSVPMGDDPSAAVDSEGRHHHLRGLWVADGSLFPSSIGVPPAALDLRARAARGAGDRPGMTLTTAPRAKRSFFVRMRAVPWETGLLTPRRLPMSRSPHALRRPLRPSRFDALVVAAVLVAGCGGKVVLDGGGSSTGGGGGAPSGTACDVTMGGVHVCLTLGGVTSSEASSFETACAAQGGTSPGACADANRLGICTVTAAGITESIVYYADGGLTASVAEQSCTSGGGTWAAG